MILIKCCHILFLFVIISVFIDGKMADIFIFFGSDGTTDVTRTVHFGTPSAFEKVRLLKLHNASQNDVHYHMISSFVSFPVF